MSLETITKNVVVDVADFGLYNSVITAKQGDNGTRFIKVTVLSNGAPYSLDGTYPVIRGTKPDGTTIFNECTIENGQIVIELTQQMLLSAGLCNYEVALYEEEPSQAIGNPAVVATSFPLTINVVASTFDPSGMVSSDEFQVLNEVMQNVPLLANLDDYAAYVQEVLEHVGNHTLGADVPADAVFHYDEADENNAGLMSASDYSKLAGIESGAEANQNAVGSFTVGGTTVAATAESDSIVLTGSNVTLTPNASTKTIQIGITGTNVGDALGYTPASLDESGKIPVDELPAITGGSVVEASEVNGNIVVDGSEMQVYDYDADTALKSYIANEIADAIGDALSASY